MNEEEKKAIEDFKECYGKDISRYIVKRNGLILNLIEKQQKEIEEYKILLKKQGQLEQEKQKLIKQGWLNE